MCNINGNKTRSDQESRNSCVTVFGNEDWMHIFADRVLFEMAWTVVLQLIPFFCCGTFP